MSNELSFEKLQELKDLKNKCEDNLKGEKVIITAEKESDELETKINKLQSNLSILNEEKSRLAAITSGRPGLENSKLILKDLKVRIPELESVFKSQTS